MEGIQHRLDCPATKSGGLPPPHEDTEQSARVGEYIVELVRCSLCHRAGLIHRRAAKETPNEH